MPPKNYKKKSTETLFASSGIPPFLEDPRFFKQLFSYIGDEFILIDNQGTIVFANDAVVQGLGYSRSYILGKKITLFLNEKMSLSVWKKKYFQVLKRKQTPLSYRIERVAKSGEVRTLDITAVYMVYEGQELIFSYGRDVTRQVQLQSALYDSKNLYRFLTEGARDGIAALDAQGRFVYANASLQIMFGFDPQDYRGRHFMKFVQKEGARQARDVFNRAKNGEGHIRAEIHIKAVSGEMIPLEISVTPMVKSGKVVSIHLIARDLRARQKIEEMQRQAEKMEAMRYFITGTAQELKNPLLGITKRAQTLLKKYADRDFEYISFCEFEDIMSNLAAIKDQMQYCYDTSCRLIRMGQKKAGMAGGRCHPCHIIEDVLKDKQAYLQENDVRHQFSLTARDAEVRMSAPDLAHILNNLIDNAVQAMPSGGVLSVKAGLNAEKSFFVIEVRDRGVGIPKEQLQHIFEPFFTTKARGLRKNSGLGLSIAYALVRDCQGDMHVKSSLRRGTVVTIMIPLYSSRRRRTS